MTGQDAIERALEARAHQLGLKGAVISAAPTSLTVSIPRARLSATCAWPTHVEMPGDDLLLMTEATCANLVRMMIEQLTEPELNSVPRETA